MIENPILIPFYTMHKDAQDTETFLNGFTAPHKNDILPFSESWYIRQAAFSTSEGKRDVS